MRAADVTTAVVLFLLGAVVLVDAIRLGIGWGTDGPKSGFFPFWLAAGMKGARPVVAAPALRTAPGGTFVTREQLGPVIKVFVPALAMVIATHVIGLYVASAIYIGGYMRWIGRHSWIAVVLLSIGIPVVTFVVFEQWFLVPMP